MTADDIKLTNTDVDGPKCVKVTFTLSLPLTFQNTPLDLAPGDAKELVDVGLPQPSERHRLCM